MSQWKSSSTLPPDYSGPLHSTDYPSLRIYLPIEAAENDVSLDIKNDIYKETFYTAAHQNFIATEETDNVILSVLDEPISKKDRFEKFRVLKTTKKDYQELEVDVEDQDLPLPVRLEKGLKATLKLQDIYHVKEETFPSNLLKVEESHCQKRTAMKIGLIYCRKGQQSPQDMFKNGTGGAKCSDSFWNFLKLFGQEIDLNTWTNYMGDMKVGERGKAYYEKWKNIEIMYHVAPVLDAEGHRRLIGNDIAVMIFLEEGADTKFDPSQIGTLGTVPQIFAVVQPVGVAFSIAFFTNRNIKPFGPNAPNKLVSPTQMKDMVLTKLHNGLVMANYCSPMNRLFYVPRQNTLESLISKYPPERQRSPRLRRGLPNVITAELSNIGQNVFSSLTSGFDKWKEKEKDKDKGKPRAAEPSYSTSLSISWPEKRGEPTMVSNVATTPVSLRGERSESKIVTQLHEHLHGVLSSILEVYLDDPVLRSEYIEDIISIGHNSGKMLGNDSLITQMKKIMDGSRNQIHATWKIEKPIISLQSLIRGWNVNTQVELISPITKAWEAWISSERQYVEQVESIMEYHELLQQRMEHSSKFPNITAAKFESLFLNVDSIATVARQLLMRLDARYRYLPIVAGIGNIFTDMKSNLETCYQTYLSNLPALLESWHEVMSDEFIAEVLLPAQKQSRFPDVPLSSLIRLPLSQVSKYEEYLVSVTCELAGIELVSKRRVSRATPVSIIRGDNKDANSSPVDPVQVPPSPRSLREVAKILHQPSHGHLHNHQHQNSLPGLQISAGNGSVRLKQHKKSKSFERNNTINILNPGSWSGGTKKRKDIAPKTERSDRSLERSYTDKTEKTPEKPEKAEKAGWIAGTPTSSNSTNSLPVIAPVPPGTASGDISFFTVHFPPSHKRSVVLDPAKSIRSDVEKVCRFRSSNVNDFVVVDASNAIVSLDTPMGEIEGGEVFLTTPDSEHQLLTVYLPQGKKQTLLFTSEMTLNNVIPRLLISRGFPVEAHVLTDKNGNVLAMDSLIQDIPSFEVKVISSEDKKADESVEEIEQFHKAVAAGDAGTVGQILKNAKSDVLNSLDSQKQTALHMAAAKGDLNMVKLLVKAGANITASNELLWTPLHSASIHKHLEVVEFLIKKGHDPNIPNIDGNTCLHYLARNKNADKILPVLDLVISAGATVDARNNNDETPLYAAAHHGVVEVCEYLIGNGATLDVKTKKGVTLIQQARTHAKEEIVKLLEFASANTALLSYSDLQKRKTHIIVPKPGPETASAQTQSSGWDDLKESLSPKILSEMKELWTAAKLMRDLNKTVRGRMSGKYVLNMLQSQSLEFKEKFGSESENLLQEGDLIVVKKDRQEYHFFLFENTLLLALASNVADAAKKKKFVVKYVVPLKFTKIEVISEITKEWTSFRVTCTHASPSLDLELVTDVDFFNAFKSQIEFASSKVFGVPLAKLMKREALLHGDKLPAILQNGYGFLLRHGIVDGIFREAGPPADVNLLKEKYDEGVIRGELKSSEHVVASLLKQFFRELPEPLIPPQEFDQLLSISASREDEFASLAQPILFNLPDANYYVLKSLLDFLLNISFHSAITNLDCESLGTIFAPLITKQGTENGKASVVAKLILHSKHFEKERNDVSDWFEEFKKEKLQISAPPAPVRKVDSQRPVHLNIPDGGNSGPELAVPRKRSRAQPRVIAEPKPAIPPAGRESSDGYETPRKVMIAPKIDLSKVSAQNTYDSESSGSDSQMQDTDMYSSAPSTPAGATDSPNNLQRAQVFFMAKLVDLQTSLQNFQQKIPGHAAADLANSWKTIKAMKQELNRVKEFLPITFTPRSYSLPSTPDRLEQVRAGLASEASTVSRILTEIQNVVPTLQRQELILLIKTFKSVFEVCKSL